MQYSAMKTRVSKYLGRDNPLIGDYINQRQKQVCRYFNFSFLQKTFPEILTSVGIQDYDLPADFKDDLHVYYTDSTGQKIPLEQIDLLTAFETYGTTAESTGEPEAWTLQSATFSIWPMPDSVYSIGIEGYGYLADLVNDTDHNYLTDTIPELLIEGALADAFEEIGLLEEAAAHEGKFQMLLKGLRIQDVERSLAGVQHLIPHSGSRR